MNARDELATIIGEQFEHPAGPACSMCEDIVRAAAAVEVMGYRKPRTITTVEELEAAYRSDVNVVLVDDDGSVLQNLFGGWKSPAGEKYMTSDLAFHVFGPTFTVLHEGAAA